MDSSSSNKKLVWYTDILPRTTHKALSYLARESWLKRTDWYLAGGTALALQVGHRSSIDLDFFTTKKDFSAARLIGHFQKEIWKTETLREGTIYGSLLGAKVSFIAYPFFVPHKKFKPYGALRILDQDDIAVMKIVTISQRGRKRDFVDLYWYCLNREPLERVLQHLPSQYPTVAHDYHHIIKSLTYFVDAEEDPMPEIFFKATWKGIKKFFRDEVKKVTRELLKLV